MALVDFFDLRYTLLLSKKAKLPNIIFGFDELGAQEIFAGSDKMVCNLSPPAVREGLHYVSVPARKINPLMRKATFLRDIELSETGVRILVEENFFKWAERTIPFKPADLRHFIGESEFKQVYYSLNLTGISEYEINFSELPEILEGRSEDAYITIGGIEVPTHLLLTAQACKVENAKEHPVIIRRWAHHVSVDPRYVGMITSRVTTG